jgi:chlorobactene glucosyltransferase
MATYLTHGLIISFIFFQLVVLSIILSNILVLHCARLHVPPNDFPSVSILVPARNEEKSIDLCIQSLLAQDYPSYEVIALDDQSSDGTLNMLEQIASSQPRLKVLVGTPPPEGISGKNWACAQLADQSQGDLLLFTDADTVFKPHSLRLIVSSMSGEQADLLTGFPRQHVHTWGERLLVPFFSWAVLCFIPLWLAYRLRMPVLSSAVGQMMLFRREAYRKIGGHENLGPVIVDDLVLARRIKAADLRWRVMNVSDLITCRMYHGSREAFDGFSKNLFATFDFHVSVFLFVYIWLGMLFLEPLIILAALTLGQAQTARLSELVICIGLSLLLWLIPYFEMGVPLPLGLIYPLTILANEVVAFQSLRLSMVGRLSWKGRPLGRPKWKWL